MYNGQEDALRSKVCNSFEFVSEGYGQLVYDSAERALCYRLVRNT